MIVLHFCWVRRAARQQARNLAKIAGSKHARGENAEAPRRLLRIVTKAVNDPALDEDRLTRLEHDVAPVDAQGQGAGQAINGFVPALVIMVDGHARVRLHDHLERVEAAGGLVFGLEKLQLHAANSYCF